MDVRSEGRRDEITLDVCLTVERLIRWKIPRGDGYLPSSDLKNPTSPSGGVLNRGFCRRTE